MAKRLHMHAIAGEMPCLAELAFLREAKELTGANRGTLRVFKRPTKKGAAFVAAPYAFVWYEIDTCGRRG